MPKYGEVKLTNKAADALKERAKAEFEKQKQRARGAKLLFREFIEAKIGNSASNYYNAIAPRRMMNSTLEAILKAFGFAPDDATLYDPDGTLMNVKPVYTIIDTRRNVKVDVCFAPLTASDTKILRGEDWEGARFRDVWIETAEQEAGWKLTLCEGKISLFLDFCGSAMLLNSTAKKERYVTAFSKRLRFIGMARRSGATEVLAAFW